MPIPFQPPEAVIQSYLNRPTPGQMISNGVLQGIQTYLQAQALQKQQQQEALGTYVKAYDAGGKRFAKNVGDRIGLVDPPGIPGADPFTRAPRPGASDPGLMEDPSALHSAPEEPANPIQGPTDIQMSPIIAHWNNTMGGGQQQPMPAQQPTMGQQPPIAAPQQMPAAPSFGAAQSTPQNPQPQGVPGLENPEQYLDDGNHGLKILQGGEALGKYKNTMQDAAEKDLENAPRSANQIRQDFALAKQPGMADDWIRAHVPEALDNPDKPLINVARIKEAKDWLTTGAQQQKSGYFETMGDINTQKFRQDLIKDARAQLDPYFATGEGRAQIQRLNNIGRTEPLIAQISAQKDSGDPRQMRELATRVDSVLRGTTNGTQAIEGINALVPSTMRGDYAKIAEWWAAEPKGTQQQAFVNRLADTVGREKGAIQNQIKQTAERAARTLRVMKSNHPEDYDAIVTPYLSGKYGELTGPQKISSNEEFNALPSGAQFIDGNGQLHTKI